MTARRDGHFSLMVESILEYYEEWRMAKNWIAGAIKHPGALHAQLGVPMGKKIPKPKLAKVAKRGGKLGKRARLAQTLAGFNR